MFTRGSARIDERLHRIGPDVVNDNVKDCAPKVQGRMAPHGTKPDESDDPAALLFANHSLVKTTLEAL